MKMEKGLIRQGDVVLIPVEGILDPIEAQVSSQVILAEGEATGHAHRLSASAVADWVEDGQRYIRVLSEDMGTLQHEDHDPNPVAVIIPQVTYKVIPQKVWDLKGEWRKVVD